MEEIIATPITEALLHNDSSHQTAPESAGQSALLLFSISMLVPGNRKMDGINNRNS